MSAENDHGPALRRRLGVSSAAFLLVTAVLALLTSRQVNEPADSRTTPPSPQVLSLPAGFTLQDKIGQLLMLGVTDQAAAVRYEQQYQIGGFLLRPKGDVLTRRATAAIGRAGALPPLFAVDEEGGQVARLSGVAVSADSAKYMGTLPDARVTALGKQMGGALAAIGANVDFAPVADLDDGDNAAIAQLDRSFSADPGVVARKAGAFASGLRAAGIVPTFKHFPGLGHAAGPTDGDTDSGPATTPPLAVLQASDLTPYATLLRGDAPAAVMVGNQIVPDLTAGLPASLSPYAYRLLRQNYGFAQVVCTDELGQAKAITSVESSPGAAVVAALAAGADMPLVNVTYDDEVRNIVAAVAKAVGDGRISEAQLDAALARVLQLKTVLYPSLPHKP